MSTPFKYKNSLIGKKISISSYSVYPSSPKSADSVYYKYS